MKIVYIFLIFCGGCLVECTTHYRIMGQKVICKSSSRLVHNISCGCTKINQTNDMYNFDLFLKRGVKLHNYSIRVSLFHRKENEVSYRPFLGISNYSIDICAYNSGRLTSILMDIIISDVKKYTNFFQPCPFSGHLYANDFILDDSKFPPIVPSGDYIWRNYGVQKINNRLDEIIFEAHAFLEVKQRR